MNLWLFVIVSNVVVFLFVRLFVYPRKKKLIVNPTEYEYINRVYLYVDNKIDGDINRREEISADKIIELLNRIPVEIRGNRENGIRNCYVNSVLELQALVRKYKVCVNKEIIRKIDECMELCNYTHICILLEVRAILCAQMRS